MIKFIRQNNKSVLKGFNTDIIGFTESIRPHLKPHHKQALILGTGGVSKAVDFSLKELGMKTKFISRTSKHNQLTYNQLTKEILDDFLVIVNASPVGMYPHIDDAPAIPYEYVSDRHLLFDTVYNPSETLFMKKGKAQGADVMNGEQMLILQAEAAWKIWNE